MNTFLFIVFSIFFLFGILYLVSKGGWYKFFVSLFLGGINLFIGLATGNPIHILLAGFCAIMSRSTYEEIKYGYTDDE